MRRKQVTQKSISRRAFCTSSLGLLAAGSAALAQAPADPNRNLVEPLYREAKAKIEPTATLNQHPLDPALARARDGLRNIQENIRDYSATMVKEERIGDTLLPPEYMYAKIRNEQVANGRVVSPFSVYLYFLKPASIAGREVIYVRGQNSDKMVAHEPSHTFKGKFGSVWLRPDGALAMHNNRYPITEIGLQTLVERLIEKGTRDKKNGRPEECQVEFFENAKINGRVCTRLRVTHPVPRDYFDFHIAEIFIDEEYNVPLRYAAFTWPSRPNGNPELIEAYTYLKLKLNEGFADSDFDYENEAYNF